MQQASQSPYLARFESFEVNLRSGELRNNGEKIKLPEQSFRILTMLLERPGEVILRPEIQKKLWPNDTVVEFENSINSAIKKLRLALGDSAEQPRYIETLARRGYRWKTPVEWVEAASEDSKPPAASPQQNLIGKRVSHYRVLEILGGGGMGVVYKAEDIKLGRRVALKFLPEELADDAAAMQRFEREARAASALNHPNICTIHAVEEHEGQPFLVMELLEGRTLRDMIVDQASPEGKAALQLNPLLDTAVQIANGLEAAHQKGIIHRDIKPANIFITNYGQAKILDFGLAKLHEFEPVEMRPQASAEPAPKQECNPLLTLTRAGVTVGTAAYMSPEQVRGEKLDQRTDLFSFGLVLYEMATRQRAFPGETAAALHNAILNQTPSPAGDLNPQIPAKLETIISKAIEKDRVARYQTATEVRADLADLQRQLAPKHLSRAWAWGLGVAAAILIATFSLQLAKKPRTVSVTPEIKLRQLTMNSSENPVIGGQISPNGNYLAYSDTRGLHIKLIDTGETRTVPEPEALKDQSVKWEVGPWFPDSTRFLVNIHPSTEDWNEWSSVNTSIWAVSVFGGVPTKLRDHAVAWAVSPDGSLVSFGTNKGKLGEREIWLMSANGEQARKFQETSENNAIGAFGWSPDAEQYGYIFTDASGDTMLSRDTKGGPPITLFVSSELKKMDDIVWLPHGRVVYSLHESEALGSACNYWMMRLDLRTGERIEPPRRLTNWPGFCVYSGSASADGRRLAFMQSSEYGTAYIADLEAGGTRILNPKHFTLEDGDDFVLDWTADSKTAIVGQNRGDHYGLYKQSLDSDVAEPIVSTVSGGVLNTFVMSPDGKWVIATVWPVPGAPSPEHPSSPRPLVRIPISGGNPETVFQVVRPGASSCARPPSTLCVVPEQTEDHKQMVVTAFDPIKGRGPELARFDLARDIDLLLENLLCDLSPDGARLAITRSPESPIEIHSLRGQPTRIIPSSALGKLIGIKWAPDGQGFFVTRRVQGGSESLHVDLHGNTKSLWKCVGSFSCFGAPSPDGRHLAIYDSKQSRNMWVMENF